MDYRTLIVIELGENLLAKSVNLPFVPTKDIDLFVTEGIDALTVDTIAYCTEEDVFLIFMESRYIKEEDQDTLLRVGFNIHSQDKIESALDIINLSKEVKK